MPNKFFNFKLNYPQKRVLPQKSSNEKQNFDKKNKSCMSSLQKDLNYSNDQQETNHNINDEHQEQEQEHFSVEEQNDESVNSQVFPKLAGDLKRDDFICFRMNNSNTRPCKIVEIESFKNGKHGSAKCSIVAEDIFIVGRKYEIVAPSSFPMLCPFVTKNEYQRIDIKKKKQLSHHDEKTFEQRQDLDLPVKENEELCRAIVAHFENGKDVTLISLKALDLEQIIAFRL